MLHWFINFLPAINLHSNSHYDYVSNFYFKLLLKSRFFNVSLISHLFKIPNSSSKKNYPNLFRIVPSENEFNAPRLALLKKYNWTRVGTLYQNQPRYLIY